MDFAFGTCAFVLGGNLSNLWQNMTWEAFSIQQGISRYTTKAGAVFFTTM
jgi:hypothetical protein